MFNKYYLVIMTDKDRIGRFEENRRIIRARNPLEAFEKAVALYPEKSLRSIKRI